MSILAVVAAALSFTAFSFAAADKCDGKCCNDKDKCKACCKDDCKSCCHKK
jgi:hypothetical protein